MQEAARRLIAFMAQNNLSQQELAHKAGVSQSSVSRVLSKTPERRGGARSKLLAYASIHQSDIRCEPGKGTQKVVEAFERIWDGSELQANVVVRIIEALEDLSPINNAQRKK
jgi:transcriptional regulator with XRE-family HTH domain